MTPRALIVVLLVACGHSVPQLRLTEDCPSKPWPDYEGATEAYTRQGAKQDVYQQIIEVSAIFKSPEWRIARAARDAKNRGLGGELVNQALAQACAEMAGPYEFELLVTTWDRRENDLDRGDKSVWRVRLIDEKGNEVAPLEIRKDKRPAFTVRADYPALGDFATPYIALFPRPAEGGNAILGPNVQQLHMRISGRGYVDLVWKP